VLIAFIIIIIIIIIKHLYSALKSEDADCRGAGSLRLRCLNKYVLRCRLNVCRVYVVRQAQMSAGSEYQVVVDATEKARLHRRGLLRQMFVCLSVGHVGELCKNG